jgi:uncharacterized protein
MRAVMLLSVVCVTGSCQALSAEPAPRATPAPIVEKSISTDGAKVASSPASAPPAEKSNDKPGEANNKADQSAQTAAGPGANPAAPAKTPHIALIVPSESKAFGRVADAVKQGFIAGADAEGKNAMAFRVYAAEDDTAALAALKRKAASEGAIAIVGGVTRDGAAALAKESGSLPALALNAPGAPFETDAPERFFYVTLNLDWEARLAARAASDASGKRIAIVVGASSLSRRIADSFEKEWTRVGGEVAAKIPLADSFEGVRLKSTFDRAKADMIFLSVDTRVARAVRPYLPSGTPVYATSQSLDARAGTVANLDLDGMRVLEMPWLVEKDHPAVMAYNKPADGTPLDYERLYALGIDAWRLMQLILKADKPRNIPPLDGVIGKLTLDGPQFVRALSTVEIRDGRAIVSRSAE